MKETVQVVLINKDKQILGVSRKTDHKDFGLPGGKIDPEDKSPEEAIVREVKEETGLDIYNIRLVFAMHKMGLMGYTYLADYSGEINTEEPHVVKWVEYKEVLNGSFGRWNKLVLESLNDMGIKVRINPIPKTDWLFTVFINPHSGNNELQVSVCPRKFYEKNGHLPDRFSDKEYEEFGALEENGGISLAECEENVYEISKNGKYLETREEIDSAMIEAGFIKDEKFYNEFNS